MTRTRFVIASVLLSCARGAPPPAEVRPAPSVTDELVASNDAEITADHARRVVAAALEWRRAHLGTCPTTKDVTDTYQLGPGIENDAKGARLVIECREGEVRVLSDGRAVVAQPYAPAAARPVPTEPPDVYVAPPAGQDPKLREAEAVIASLRARFRRCYSVTLDHDPRTPVMGPLHGEMVIAPDGTIRQVVFDKKSGPPETLRCLEQAFKGTASGVETHGKETRAPF